jgi:hypothetical protein
MLARFNHVVVAVSAQMVVILVLAAGPGPSEAQSIGDLSAWVSVQELSTSGSVIDVPYVRTKSIVSKQSRVRITFNRTVVLGVLNGAVGENITRQLNELRSDPTHTNRTQRLAGVAGELSQKQAERRTASADRHQALDAEIEQLRTMLQNVQELIVAAESQAFLDAGGIAATITARIFPRQGTPYDVAVDGYTTVEEVPGALPPARPLGNNTPAEPTVVNQRVTRSIEPHYLRWEPRLSPSGSGPAAPAIRDDLDDGLIRLPSDRIADGDLLVVTVTNVQGGHPQSLVWEMELLDIGVKTSQDATLLLVKRDHNPTGEGIIENNYKAAPGTSFLLKFTTRNRVMNFLQPAFGINASFLDFAAAKDLEIGVGPVFSVLNGIVQVSWGWNLNAGSDRSYFSLGLGFLDIAGKIQELAKK